MCGKSMCDVFACACLILLAFIIGIIGNIIAYAGKYGEVTPMDMKSSEIWDFEGNFWIWFVGSLCLMVTLLLLCTACEKAMKRKATDLCYAWCCNCGPKKQDYDMLNKI